MDEAGVAGWVTSDELAEAGRFVREGRRREYLTWRAVVRRELGADVRIAYDAAGAPVVDRDGVYVGVSHCRGRVAVCLSDVPCAVDIEPETRDFSRAAPRYMSPSELALSGDPLLPAACLVRQGGALQICPAPGAGLAARPAGGGGGFCGWNRCRAHRRRGGDPAHAASCRRVYHGIYGIVPAGLPHGKAPPREGAFPYVSCSRGAGS